MGKAGRKSKYNKEISAKMTSLAREGKTDVQIAEIVGISPRTLAYWKTNFPEFLQALNGAKKQADNIVELSLYRRATGYYHPEEKVFFFQGRVHRVETMKHYPPDTSAMIFWLKNRQPATWRDALALDSGKTQSNGSRKSFQQFCEDANYPLPYDKQIEMMRFGMTLPEARLLLGSRGYGKTDYVVILGVAYKLYCDYFDGRPKFRMLLVTKSDERNAAILSEICKAAQANGVTFEKESATCLRVKGLLGKDHSVSSVTIGTSSLRGRHPDLIVMDDPVTEEDVSEATRKKVQRVYNELMKLSSNVLVIGQPVHKQDLYQKLRPLLKCMELPHGTIPELDHDLEAQRLAGVSEESIQASYFLKVSSENAAPLENVKFIESFPPGGNAVAFIDPSFEGGDFTALSIGKAHFDGIAVVGHTWKRAWNHVLPEIKAKLIHSGVRRLCFETNSLGDMPIQILREALKDTGIGVVGKKSTGFKHSRIMNAGTFAHLIHLAKTSDRVYIEQVVMYEYGVSHDDAPDSLASLLEWLGLIRGKK
jgi:hypothetical protein